MSWWVPIALVGAVLVGVALAFSLTAGRPQARTSADDTLSHHGGARPKSRYEQDNELAWNRGAFVAVAGMVGLLVLVGVLAEVL